MNSKIVLFISLLAVMLLFPGCADNKDSAKSVTSTTSALLEDSPDILSSGSFINLTSTESLNFSSEDVASNQPDSSLNRTVPGQDGVPGLDVFHYYYPPILFDVGGKLAYSVIEGGRMFIYLDGIKIGSEYDDVDYPSVVAGKIAYAGFKDDSTFIVWGNETAKVKGGYYLVPAVSPLFQTFVEDNGALAYALSDKNPYEQRNLSVYESPAKYYLFSGGQLTDVTSKYTNIYLIPSVKEKLSFIASNNNGKKLFVVSGGEEIGKEYDSVLMAGEGNVVQGGKMGYVAARGDNYYFIYDGSQISNVGQDEVVMIIDVNGESAYLMGQEAANPGGIKFFIRSSGLDLGKEYDNICPFFGLPIGKCTAIVDGKIAYLADKSNKYFVVFNGKEYGKEYDQVYSVASVGNKLFYLASRNQTFYIVSDGKDTSVPTERINWGLTDGLTAN